MKKTSGETGTPAHETKRQAENTVLMGVCLMPIGIALLNSVRALGIVILLTTIGMLIWGVSRDKGATSGESPAGHDGSPEHPADGR